MHKRNIGKNMNSNNSKSRNIDELNKECNSKWMKYHNTLRQIIPIK